MKESELLIGRNAAREVLRYQPSRILRVVTLKGSSFPEDLSGLIQQSTSQGTKHEELERAAFLAAFPKLSDELTHQGVALELSPKKKLALADLLGESPKENDVLVALDQVTDPQNLGAVFRVCEACAVRGLLIPENRSCGVTHVVRKASVGASELVEYCFVKNLVRALEAAKKAGYWILGAARGEGAEGLYRMKPPRPVCLVIGSEGEGLRKLTKEKCDLLVEIPMRGKVSSLNVSQATSIILYELLRSGNLRNGDE